MTLPDHPRKPSLCFFIFFVEITSLCTILFIFSDFPFSSFYFKTTDVTGLCIIKQVGDLSIFADISCTTAALQLLCRK
jgi:hypothetical protein